MNAWMKTRALIEDHLESLGCGLDHDLVSEYLLEGLTISELTHRHHLSAPTVRLYLRRALKPIAKELHVVSPILGTCSACSKTFRHVLEEEEEDQWI